MARSKRPTDEDLIASAVPEKHAGAKVFAEIAKRSKSFRPAVEVLRRVRAVPTIFPGLDHILRVGGWPTDRTAMVHGPSGFGKTKFAQGLGFSFLRRNHIYAFMDAEHTTPFPWLQALFGQYASNPRFIASRPENYEQGVDDVKAIATGVAEARVRGDIDPDTTCLFVVDSIGKLVPRDIQERLRKHLTDSDKGSIDGFSGMAGMIKAGLNKSWLDQLVPLMSSTGCCILFVAREAVDRNASKMARNRGSDWKTTGGDSLYYDASLDIRISDAEMIHEQPKTVEGYYKTPVVGERHEIEIHKTKVSQREAKIERCTFTTSNGLWTPEGFDRARDLLDVGTDLEVIEQSGAWLKWNGNRWQGARRFLCNVKVEQLDAIELEVRAKFGSEARADVVGG